MGYFINYVTIHYITLRSVQKMQTPRKPDVLEKKRFFGIKVKNSEKKKSNEKTLITFSVKIFVVDHCYFYSLKCPLFEFLISTFSEF